MLQNNFLTFRSGKSNANNNIQTQNYGSNSFLKKNVIINYSKIFSKFKVLAQAKVATPFSILNLYLKIFSNDKLWLPIDKKKQMHSIFNYKNLNIVLYFR